MNQFRSLILAGLFALAMPATNSFGVQASITASGDLRAPIGIDTVTDMNFGFLIIPAVADTCVSYTLDFNGVVTPDGTQCPHVFNAGNLLTAFDGEAGGTPQTGGITGTRDFAGLGANFSGANCTGVTSTSSRLPVFTPSGIFGFDAAPAFSIFLGGTLEVPNGTEDTANILCSFTVTINY